MQVYMICARTGLFESWVTQSNFLAKKTFARKALRPGTLLTEL